MTNSLRRSFVVVVGIRAFVVQQDVLPRGVSEFQDVLFPQFVISLGFDRFVVEVSLVGGAQVDDVRQDAFAATSVVSRVSRQTILEHGVLFRTRRMIDGNIGD